MAGPATPIDGEPWTSDEVDEATQQIIDHNAELAQRVGNRTLTQLEDDLSDAFAPVGLQREPYTVPLATEHERSDLTEFIISGKDEGTGKLYGQRLSNGNFCTSDDGETYTDVGENPYVQIGTAPQQFQFTESFMYATTATGKIWRAPKDDFANWTDISVPDLPAATTGRVSVLAISGDGAVLLYCNYNSSPATPEGAYLWRSTDNGATWTLVYDLSHPAAKHSHAVKFDPWNPGHAYFSVGDNGWPSAGLHRSIDYGLTWEPCALTTRSVGIDMVFPEPVDGVPEMIVLEGDVMNGAHLYVHYKGTDELLPLVWYTGALDDPDCTMASTRGIGLTPNGDLIYMTTTEGGTFGVKAGIYVARGPWFKEAILLEDITGEEPPGYVQTVMTDTHVIQRAVKFNIPEFAS